MNVQGDLFKIQQRDRPAFAVRGPLEIISPEPGRLRRRLNGQPAKGSLPAGSLWLRGGNAQDPRDLVHQESDTETVKFRDNDALFFKVAAPGPPLVALGDPRLRRASLAIGGNMKMFCQIDDGDDLAAQVDHAAYRRVRPGNRDQPSGSADDLAHLRDVNAADMFPQSELDDLRFIELLRRESIVVPLSRNGHLLKMCWNAELKRPALLVHLFARRS